MTCLGYFCNSINQMTGSQWHSTTAYTLLTWQNNKANTKTNITDVCQSSQQHNTMNMYYKQKAERYLLNKAETCCCNFNPISSIKLAHPRVIIFLWFLFLQLLRGLIRLDDMGNISPAKKLQATKYSQEQEKSVISVREYSYVFCYQSTQVFSI